MNTASWAIAAIAVLVVVGCLTWAWMVWGRRAASVRASALPDTPVAVTVVVNPTKVGESQRRRAERALRRAGADEVRFVETTVADPGLGQARAAGEAGADVVVAYGGDGTVRACVAGLAGSNTPLAVFAGGTGNLLARNLGIPHDVESAAAVAVRGARRRIDVGAVVTGNGEERFAVMAGMGFDAALLRDAPEEVKARVGPIAYVFSGLRNLRSPGFGCEVTVDDRPPIRRRVRTVLVGNVGRLQGRLPVLPDATPDDGLLDVIVISPRTRLDWARVAWRVVVRRPHPVHTESMRGRRVVIEAATPQPIELDGDVLADTPRMVCEIEPAALLLCVPR